MTGDSITITGIRARGRHGVLDFERHYGQEFVVDVTMTINLRQAGLSDELTDTVSYADVASAVRERIVGKPVKLIEALAEQIAGDVLALPRVTSVRVTVHKPHAPIDVPFDDVQVTVTRPST